MRFRIASDGIADRRFQYAKFIACVLLRKAFYQNQAGSLVAGGVGFCSKEIGEEIVLPWCQKRSLGHHVP